MARKTLEEEIDSFFDMWGSDEMTQFFEDTLPLCALYDVDFEQEDDWVKDLVGEEDAQNVRMIRTVYLMSKFAERHAGKLCSLKMQYKDLYKRMEKQFGKPDFYIETQPLRIA